jgi:ADP-heptose:LPS heptosyltransferase
MELNGEVINKHINIGNIWNETGHKSQAKQVSKTKLRQLGLSKDGLNFVETLKDLRKMPPNIIIATATTDVHFVQNWSKKQFLKKNNKYVMGLGVFQQLQYDFNSNKKLLKPSKIKFSRFYNPYKGQDLTDKTLLIFRTGGIGDLLFIKPNLDYIKQRHTTCKIKFACGPQYQPMVENWSCVDELLDLPFALKHLIECDYHSLFEGVIERCKESHVKNSYNLFSKWMGLDLPDELLVPKQEAKPDLVESCKDVLDGWGVKEGDFILAQLRASSPIRTPNHQFWVSLFNKLIDKGYNIVLTDNPRQTQSIDDFIKLVSRPDKIFNFCEHSKSLDHSIALTSLASMTLCTDSAFSHIGVSVGIPAFAIMGPFPGYVRLKTYPNVDWVDAERHCAPCFIHGQDPCPQASNLDGYSPCYDGINKDEVVERIGKLLEKVKETG